jgi:hypothetical protein
MGTPVQSLRNISHASYIDNTENNPAATRFRLESKGPWTAQIHHKPADHFLDRWLALRKIEESASLAK